MKITITRVREIRIEGRVGDDHAARSLEVETAPGEELGDFVEVLLAQFASRDAEEASATSSNSLDSLVKAVVFDYSATAGEEEDKSK